MTAITSLDFNAFIESLDLPPASDDKLTFDCVIKNIASRVNTINWDEPIQSEMMLQLRLYIRLLSWFYDHANGHGCLIENHGHSNQVGCDCRR